MGLHGHNQARLMAGLLTAAVAIPVAAQTAHPLPSHPTAPGVARPKLWPAYDYPVPTRIGHEQMIAALIARMTLAEKIAQARARPSANRWCGS
jgi:beta-glucosidase